MTRKHFIEMAATIRRVLTASEPIRDADRARARHTADAFISLAERDNPRFDRVRFLVACGLEDKRT